MIETLGARTIDGLGRFGDFCRFTGTTLRRVVESALRWKAVRTLWSQFYEIGTRSIPVVMITGTFIGAVLAVQTVNQFRGIGMVEGMGTIIVMSVLRELGPVLAGVLLAGRVGGGLTAELGTMRVTEQIDALRAMGTDPVRVLVLPRFLACVMLIPVLVLYANAMGIFGGWAVTVHVYGVNSASFWRAAQNTVAYFDIFYGPIKSIFFGAFIGLISCYKGFNCDAGAAGVGRACTEAFVASCMTILGLNLFLGMLLNTLYEFFYGVKVVL
jgi:phospholipid/cholesterol/gamma-HCH transport system permease protein